jgi:transposase
LRRSAPRPQDLLALRDWLTAHEVTHVAMESTGVYWKCVYYVLEDDFEEVMLVNARHIKARPGSQDRHDRRCLDRAAAGVRAAEGQPRAAAPDPRAAGPDALSQSADL